ncbi:MAG: thioredoxin family protein [Bacteroidota bacterium]
MMKYLSLLIWLWLPLSGQAQTDLSWLGPADLMDSLRQAPKPVLVYLGADWCQYCDMMEASTFQDTTVVRKLTEDFYPVYWDVESQDAVSFLGRTYRYLPTGPRNGYHELTAFLGGKHPDQSYPLFLLFDEEMEWVDRHSGFLSSEAFIPFIQQTAKP